MVTQVTLFQNESYGIGVKSGLSFLHFESRVLLIDPGGFMQEYVDL